jgi:hypothetical protein
MTRMSVMIEVIPLACFVREVIAYECAHVRASEKKRYL